VAWPSVLIRERSQFLAVLYETLDLPQEDPRLDP
jgi:hypothetical protein